MLAEYLTKYTDYMVNYKIPIKDMAICREFLELFIWSRNFSQANMIKEANLLNKCLESDEFWNGLRDSHKILRDKYPCDTEVDYRLSRELEDIPKQINLKYKRYLVDDLPCNLEGLQYKDSSIIYSSTYGSALRNSPSIEENASFLIRWSGELYAEWATWLNHIIPDCKINHESNTQRIVDKIKGMYGDGKIE